MVTIVCKEREPINSNTGIEKKEIKKVLPNVEDQTLTVRPPCTANVAGDCLVGYLAL